MDENLGVDRGNDGRVQRQLGLLRARGRFGSRSLRRGGGGRPLKETSEIAGAGGQDRLVTGQLEAAAEDQGAVRRDVGEEKVADVGGKVAHDLKVLEKVVVDGRGGGRPLAGIEDVEQADQVRGLEKSLGQGERGRVLLEEDGQVGRARLE